MMIAIHDLALPTDFHMGLPNPRRGEGFGRTLARAVEAIPPPGLVLLSIVSIQLGAVLAIHLFPRLGPSGTVFLRVGFSALLLIVAARPVIDHTARAHAGSLLLFGCIIGGMNLCFYEAIARIPLGIAVTIEFIGPLGVAVGTSRRLLDFLWIALAVLGVGMLSPEIGSALDPLGIVFAILAGAGWAGFILASKRVGRIFRGSTGLTLAMAIAALLLLPFGVLGSGMSQIEPTLLLVALAVAVLSTTIPLWMEFEALKRLSPRAYGVLVTLEPAIAVMVGAILLGEPVGPRTLLAVSCVTVATLGVTILEGQGSCS